MWNCSYMAGTNEKYKPFLIPCLVQFYVTRYHLYKLGWSFLPVASSRDKEPPVNLLRIPHTKRVMRIPHFSHMCEHTYITTARMPKWLVSMIILDSRRLSRILYMQDFFSISHYVRKFFSFSHYVRKFFSVSRYVRKFFSFSHYERKFFLPSPYYVRNFFS